MRRMKERKGGVMARRDALKTLAAAGAAGPLACAVDRGGAQPMARFFTVAERYYRVTHDAVRRYDPHHLILGDRWEANAPLPEEVVRAALPHVDVLSFQCFGTADNIATKMRQWADFAKRPVLLADAAGHIRAPGDTGWPPTADRQHDADHYRRTMDALWQIPQSVGYHLCGAHIRNNARRYGFRDRTNAVIPETVEGIRAVNADVHRRTTGL